MNTKLVLRRLTLAVLWGMAVSTWVAIGHHLLGLPDLGILAVTLTFAATLAWPTARNRDLAPGSLETPHGSERVTASR